MSRLLTALRRIEARTDTAGATATAQAAVERSAEDHPADTISLPPQESSVWPGDIVYDPQSEYPGHWTPHAAADWPSVTHEAEYGNSSSWPNLGFSGAPEATISGQGDSEEIIDDRAMEPVEDPLGFDPVVAATPSFAEPLNHDHSIVGEALASPAVEVSTAPSTRDEVVTEVTALAAAAILPVTDEQPCAVVVSNPSTLLTESLPASTAKLKAGIGTFVASFPRMDDSPTDQVSREETLVPRQTSDDTSDEPVVSVRLPGFGRPHSRGRGAAWGTSAVGIRRPGLVPFLPPAQRPYREACESILSALPQGSSVALVLAWADEDLDHCAVSARLAEVMADRLDDPVLLIDMGPKRHLSTLLQAPAIGSLTEAMVGFVSWRDQIVQTSTAGLCLLPSGPHDFEADPVAVARLIEACKEDFAVVLIVGASLSVIPENVLTACDAAVLLVEAGHTSAAQAAGAIERLRRSGTEVAGCLLTAIAEG